MPHCTWSAFYKAYRQPCVFTDSLHGTMDGVFLFEDVAVEDSKTTQGYDAIVVEQWTVLKVCVQSFFFDFFFCKSKHSKTVRQTLT